MFQIAAGYAYSIRNGGGMSIAPRTTSDRQEYWNNFLKKCAPLVGVAQPQSGFLRILQHKCSSTVLWREPHYHYCAIPPNTGEIYGYFQSSKYFADLSAEIRDLFRPSDEIMETVRAKYGSFLGNPDICVIHIRRTDYLSDRYRSIHAVCHEKYYTRALEVADNLKPTIQYLVFSDDLEWCKQQNGWWKGRKVTFVDEPTDYIALSLMSQFSMFIIPNSSFAWWAAWLHEGEKTVIAPDRWYGPKGPQDWQDIYEPGWIQIPTV